MHGTACFPTHVTSPSSPPSLRSSLNFLNQQHVSVTCTVGPVLQLSTFHTSPPSPCLSLYLYFVQFNLFFKYPGPCHPYGIYTGRFGPD